MLTSRGAPWSGKAARGWEKGKAELEFPQKGNFPRSGIFKLIHEGIAPILMGWMRWDEAAGEEGWIR